MPADTAAVRGISLFSNGGRSGRCFTYRVTGRAMKTRRIFFKSETPGRRSDRAFRQQGTFLAEYVSWLLGAGATCIRTEKNLARMAQRFGVQADVMITPSHVQLSIRKEDSDEAQVIQRRIPSCGIRFDINTRLSRLSWGVADSRLGYAEAVSQFAAIIAASPADYRESLVLTSLANASFCRLFGGDPAAMAIVFVATFAGYRLKQIMLADKRDVRLTFLCAAFFSASISAGGHLFGWGETPDIALGTSVLYLIPGVPWINAVSDMLDRHYLCAFSRLVDACILTVCLSIGLCAGMYLLDLDWF